MTDSSAWLIQNAMSASQRSALLQELFGPPPGLNFRMLRVTIGASDFSLQHYTLDDMPAGEIDPGLQHFNVVPNQAYLIPALQEIVALRPDVQIIASPWSAPAWMKSSTNLIGGALLEQYESVFADYLVRFVDAFQGYGIPIFALTVQNEPAFLPLTYPGMEVSTAARARLSGWLLLRARNRAAENASTAKYYGEEAREAEVLGNAFGWTRADGSVIASPLRW